MSKAVATVANAWRALSVGTVRRAQSGVRGNCNDGEDGVDGMGVGRLGKGTWGVSMGGSLQCIRDLLLKSCRIFTSNRSSSKSSEGM
jgi:hypothetical protein